MVSWTDVDSSRLAIVDEHPDAELDAAALKSDEQVYPRDRSAEAQLLLDMAAEFRKGGWADKSRRFARRALSIFEREGEPEPRDLVRALLCLAGARDDLGDHTRAEADYRRAYDLLDRLTVSAEALDLQTLRIQTLRGLASVTQALGQERQAETMLRDALAIAEDTFGSSHAQFAAVLDDLGMLCWRAGEVEEAARLHHLALSITETALGAKDLQVAAILHHLGSLERTRGRFSDGEAFVRRAAAIREGILGHDHPQVAAALLLLAALFEGQQKHFGAKQAERRASRILERWFGRRYELVESAGYEVRSSVGRHPRAHRHQAMAPGRWSDSAAETRIQNRR